MTDELLATPSQPDQETAKVRLEVLVSDQWTWASSLAGIPQVSALTLVATEALPHARVEVSLVDAELRYGSTVVHDGPLAASVNYLGSAHVPLSPSVMATVDERRTADCEVTVTVEGIVVARAASVVDVQPRDLWNWDGDPRRTGYHRALILQHLRELAVRPKTAGSLRTPAEVSRLQRLLQPASAGLSRALLASFVRPNHPEVALIAREAAEILGARTGDPSFYAFQITDTGRAAHRADETVHAVYEALRAREIAYSEPPPGWDYTQEGQRVRDHGEVARGGLGTCMDTTVLMAAVLEHVGLLPALVLIPGHIFVGYWRRDPSKGTPDWYPGESVAFDVATVSGLVEAGHLGVIETTTLTAGKSVPASRAARIAREDNLENGRAEGRLCLIDVAAARKAGARPLPAISSGEGGVVTVTVYGSDGRPEARPLVPASATPVGNDFVGERQVDTHPQRFRTWKSSLFSLNARNTLLNLGHGPTVQPFVLPAAALGDLEDRLNQDVEFRILPGGAVSEVEIAQGLVNALELEPEAILRRFMDRSVFVQRISRARTTPGIVTAGKLTSELRSMARRAKEARDEKGMNPLFLCLGILKWKHKPGVYADAPLILVPVNVVERRKGQFTVKLDASGQATPNIALIEFLKREHQLTIPGLDAPTADRAGIDVDGVLDAVREAVAARGLDLGVEAEARLAVLDLTAFRMWQDLTRHGDAFLDRPLVKHLVHTPTATFVDPVVTAPDAKNPEELEALQTPVPADATQKQAVLWAREGRTFVLQGPPGTGKSQTITNMVAECVLQGQKVLFVAEKGTALSVVQRRLDAIGLAPFTLNLHHEGSSATAVRDKLKSALNARSTPDPVAVENAARRLKAARYELEQYPTRLHRRNAVGQSAYSAHDRLLALGAGTSIDVTDAVVARGAATAEALRKTLDALPSLVAAAHVRRDHPWRLVGRVPAAEWELDAATAALRGVLAGTTWCAGISGALRDALDAVTHPSQLASLAAAADPRLPAGPVLEQVLSTSWSGDASRSVELCEKAVADWSVYLRGFRPDVLTLDLRAVAAALEAATASGIFGRGKRQAAAVEPLRAYAPAELELDAPRAAAVLTDLVQVQDAGRWAMDVLTNTPGLAPSRWVNVFADGVLVGARRRYDELKGATSTLRGDTPWHRTVREVAVSGALTPWRHELARWSGAWQEVWGLLGATDMDLHAWLDGASLARATQRHAGDWNRELTHDRLLPLRRWNALVEALQPLVDGGMEDLRADILDGRIAPDVVGEAFERGLAHASEVERVRAEGLDRFDSAAHDLRVVAYADAEAEVRSQWVTTGPARLIEQRDQNIGGLARELQKTRQRLGTRALLQRYAKTVQDLTPLVLASPSSAVDLIEPGVMEFDLVVFDEASQITVPEAVGAIGRAKAVVVVGDSKQMPPSRKVGTESASDEELDDADDEIVEDQESILSECELAQVPTLRLSWHYRSQDEALIAFSNGAYYDGDLSSFPAPTLLSSATGVELVRVEGTFIRAGSTETRELGNKIVAGKGTNADEALAIVAAVRRLLSGPTPPTVGIVTFNEQQGQLIEDLLKAAEDPNVDEAMNETAMGPSDVLFVKALERVQGDERDVVLFSVAFSKQANGKIPLNFGPLSNDGGERRLNVAVTRARRKNVVFCSFDPDELDADSASYRGVKDLKKFLCFARDAGRIDTGGSTLERVPVRDRHRDEVAEALREAGLHVLTDVGLSEFRLDLVLARPDRPDRLLLPVLLDGESWRSRRTVGDRDVLPVDVLRNLMGWPTVARIWWPMWLQNRQEVVDRILAEVDAAEFALVSSDDIVEELELPREASQPAMVTVSDGTNMSESQQIRGVVEAGDFTYGQEESLFGTGPDLFSEPEERDIDDLEHAVPAVTTTVTADVRTFVPAHSDPVGSRDVLDALPDRAAAVAVRAQVMDVIAIEGPVAIDRLVRIVGRRFGLTAVRASRALDIARLVPRAQVRKSRLGDFAWPTDLDPDEWAGYRTPDADSSRKIDEVAPKEIFNAMRDVVASGAASDDEILRRTAATFGISRLSANARSRFEAVIDEFDVS